jgi:hypothetical protein
MDLVRLHPYYGERALAPASTIKNSARRTPRAVIWSRTIRESVASVSPIYDFVDWLPMSLLLLMLEAVHTDLVSPSA